MTKKYPMPKYPMTIECPMTNIQQTSQAQSEIRNRKSEIEPLHGKKKKRKNMGKMFRLRCFFSRQCPLGGIVLAA